MDEARDYILEQYIKGGDYAFLPEGLLPKLLDTLMAYDEEFMESAGVNEGEEYDDEAASAWLFQKMTEAFPDYKMYMLRFTEDYLDYNEEYLNSIGAIEWN